MKVIQPFTIDSAQIIDTNVPDEIVQTWDSGTTYALGSRAGLAPVNGEAQIVYQSLQADNINNALSDEDWWKPIALVYPNYTSTTYGLGDIVTQGSFLFRSLVSGNTANTSDTDSWRNIGRRNRFRAFSPVVQDQTIMSPVESGIEYVIQPGKIVDSIALMNLTAVDVDIIIDDPVEGVVYSETIQLLSDDDIDNWWDYYFAPIVRETNLALFDIPAYTNAEIYISVNEPSEAKVGAIIVGQATKIGDSQYGSAFGIKDYSIKEIDDDGRAILDVRGFVDRQEIDIVVNTSRFGVVKRLLTNLRATPTVWVADETKPETIVYGYYRDFDIIISGPSVSDCLLEIRGLL